MPPIKEKSINLEAETQAAKINLEMETGKVLLAQSQKRMMETKQRLEEEQEAREEKQKQENRDREKRDTPELSRQSRWFGVEGRLLTEANLKWVLEMEQELWEALLTWEPVPGAELSKQLAELSRLYLALLEAVLTHTMGEEQIIQTDRLNDLLAQKLELLLRVTLQDLMKLLEQNRQPEAAREVRTALYRRVTGTGLSHREADAIFSGAKGKNTDLAPEAAHAGAREGGHPAGISREGTLYKSAGGGNIRVNQAFEAHRKSEEFQESLRNVSAGSPGKGSFAEEEFSLANRFAGHLQGNGNLFAHAGITARNEELKGLLAAITSIKAQVYATDYARGHSLDGPLKSAVNQMVDYYLSGRGAYSVYYQTTGVYEKTKDPYKAIAEGLEYAYRQFQEKKGASGEGKKGAYGEQAGFFQHLLWNQTQEEELKRGRRLLEENWREFLDALRGGGRMASSMSMHRYSPWGSLLGTEGPDKSRKDKRFVIKAAWVAVALAAGALCYLVFR